MAHESSAQISGCRAAKRNGYTPAPPQAWNLASGNVYRKPGRTASFRMRARAPPGEGTLQELLGCARHDYSITGGETHAGVFIPDQWATGPPRIMRARDLQRAPLETEFLGLDRSTRLF